MELINIKESYARDIFKRLKHRAKQKEIEFDLTMVDLMDLTIPITCPILGLTIEQHNGRMRDNSLSIDRIDNTRGYVKDNIMVMSWRANKLKSDATIDEIIKLGNYYIEYNKFYT